MNNPHLLSTLGKLKILKTRKHKSKAPRHSELDSERSLTLAVTKTTSSEHLIKNGANILGYFNIRFLCRLSKSRQLTPINSTDTTVFASDEETLGLAHEKFRTHRRDCSDGLRSYHAKKRNQNRNRTEYLNT